MNARIKVRILGAIMLLACARLGAEPWSMISCDPSGEAGWRTFEQAARAAKPGSPLYIPVPFPTTSDQVVRDYLYQYWSLIKGMDAKNWQPNEARVMGDLSSGKVTFQVLRVENWTVSRCHEDQKRDFYNLVRVFEPAGTEVARAVINDSGLLTTWNNLPAMVPGAVASQSRALPPAATAMAQLNSEFGLDGVDPEYVATFGTLNCVLTHPCLAFHQSGLSYVAFGNQIFEVSASEPMLTMGKEVGSPAEEALLKRLAPGERLISLGGKAFTIGRRVSAAMIRTSKSAFGR